ANRRGYTVRVCLPRQPVDRELPHRSIAAEWNRSAHPQSAATTACPLDCCASQRRPLAVRCADERGGSPSQTATRPMNHLHFRRSYKVLQKGRFPWPSTADGTARLTSAQLAMLWEGIDW